MNLIRSLLRFLNVGPIRHIASDDQHIASDGKLKMFLLQFAGHFETCPVFKSDITFLSLDLGSGIEPKSAFSAPLNSWNGFYYLFSGSKNSMEGKKKTLPFCTVYSTPSTIGTRSERTLLLGKANLETFFFAEKT